MSPREILPAPVSRSLDIAARELRRWRGSWRGGRIPGRLWQLAVEAAAVHGVAETAEALGLDSDGLRRRVAVARGAVAEFVEVLPPLSVPAAGVMLELRDDRGTSLRVELPATAIAEVAVVARALWEASR